MKSKKLIIFDLDGTLIDSAKDLALSINYMLEQVGHQTFSEETIDLWVGNGAQTLVKRALSGSETINENIDEELFEKSLTIFLDYYKNNLCVKTAPYPHVETTLKKLYSHGYYMAIVTNKPYDFVQPILKTLDIEKYFSYYIGGDSLSLKKPSPEPLLHVCQKLGISYKNSIMVGDSKNDILAANAANMQSIAVSYGYNYGEDISMYNPDITIDDFSDILGLMI